MPKILQKNICKVIIRNILFVIFAYVVAFIIVVFTNGGMDDISDIYNVRMGERYIILIVLFAGGSFFAANIALPDYLFIAPYSLEDRKKLIKKTFHISIVANYLCTNGFLVAPDIIRFVYSGNFNDMVKCIFQTIILFCVLYVLAYGRYFQIFKPGHEIGIQILLILEYAVLSGIIGEDSISKADYVIMLIAGVIGIWSVAHCYFKYYKEMIENFADYELSKQIRVKR